MQIQSVWKRTRQFHLSLKLSHSALVGFLCIALLPVAFLASTRERLHLQIVFIDVEGGQATLFITAEGQSLLIDTGWPGFDNRDADRIVAATTLAGLKKLDYVLITHYHRDHVGGATQLAARIPIGAFIDHGENRERTDPATDQGWQDYQKLLADRKIQRITLKAGDTLPLRSVRGTVVSSDGVMIDHALPGAGADNPSCATSEMKPADQTENARSLGTLLTYGKLRILDLGDLTWDKEMELVCPKNKLGRIDLFVVSHHGWLQSNSPALLNAIAPRVAIMDNGATKGGSPSAWEVIKHVPNLEDLWQLHYSEEGGPAHNTAEEFIANPHGPDGGNYLKVDAYPDGSFSVFNSRTKATKAYSAPK